MSLFLSYCPMGTLQEFLKSQAISLPTFCKFAVSTAAGLAHLHTEMHVEGSFIFFNRVHSFQPIVECYV